MRILAAIVLMFVLTIHTWAQGSTIAPSIILREQGNGNGALLVPPSALTTTPTFTFPTSSGTLLIESSTTAPTFGGLTVSGQPISLNPGVGNNISFLNIPADPLASTI